MKKIYKVLLSFICQLFNIFPIKRNRIFLMSFDGTKLGFDSLAFAEWLNTYQDGNYDIIWGINNKKVSKEMNLKNTIFIKIKSIRGLFYLKTAKVIIYNINPPSYIRYRKKQILVNTWHGFAFKKCGKYASHFNKKQFNLSTCFLSHSKLYTNQLIRDSFEYKGEILNIGTPRNDILFDKKRMSDVNTYIRRRYNISEDFKILIYAPTFRNEFAVAETTIDISNIKKSLEKKFNCKCIVFLRFHPLVENNNLKIFKDAIDVSLYPNMQDLLCASDFLITDYSSCIWDFGLTGKIGFIYADDYNNYSNGRGLYKPLESLPFPLAKNNSELIDHIEHFNYKEYEKKLKTYYSSIETYDNGKCCENLFSYLKLKGLD